MTESGFFELKSDAHISSLNSRLYEMFRDGEYTDTTLIVDDGSFKCHKMVLVASSDYFGQIIRLSECKTPTIFLRGFKAHQFAPLLKYLYTGEVLIDVKDLTEILKNAGLSQNLVSALTFFFLTFFLAKICANVRKS